MADDDDVYAAVSINEMHFNQAEKTFEYDCVCGDKFKVTLDEIRNQQEHYGYKNYLIAECPSCSLRLKVLIEEDIMETFA